MKSVDVKCEGCGTDLRYKPGTDGLTCSACNHFTKFSQPEAANEANRELNLEEYLNSFGQENQQIERRVISCSGCGAETEVEKNQQSGSCPFCDAPFVFSQSHSEHFIKPQGLLPFKIEKRQATSNFKTWLDKLWFAPNALKKQATQLEKMKGIYLPFWTYDCSTFTSYMGQRGEHYMETISEKDGNGNTVTREIQRTRWYSASGSFDYAFDDILVAATRSLPESNLDALAPWDLEKLVDYKDEYLRGYVTESYQVDVKSGYNEAKELINDRLEALVRRKIGGDEQRIISVDTSYSSATFKHILLPVWVSAYHYQNKLYQVIVNARTGAVNGQRPWSWIKITSLVVSILIAIGAVAYFVH